ncbi:MAG: glycerophosphodiester phosphodiesterase family protein, partial [Myxococcota bacterium]
MNPWYWRLGLAATAVGAGAAAFGWRRINQADRTPEPRSSDDLFPAPLTIMGHRGAAAVAPENTMVAFGAVSRLGLPFELDVQPCLGGQLVVMHDATLDRTTSGRGSVAQTSWADIKKLDAGAHFGDAFAGHRVPALDTVLATLGGEVVINIEVKPPSATASTAERRGLAAAVAALIEAHDVEKKVMVSSFDPLLLEALRKINGGIRRGLIIGTDEGRSVYDQVALRQLWLPLASQPDLLMLEKSLATAKVVQRLKSTGYRVFAWTVNDRAEGQRLVGAG